MNKGYRSRPGKSPQKFPQSVISWMMTFRKKVQKLKLKLIMTYCAQLVCHHSCPPSLYPFSQFVPQLELYSQLQLSLWSDPIDFSVPKPT